MTKAELLSVINNLPDWTEIVIDLQDEEEHGKIRSIDGINIEYYEGQYQIIL